MGNARQMLGMVVAAANGLLDDGQQSALSAQIAGAFAAMPVIGGNIVRLARTKDWDGLTGAIGSYIDIQEAGSRTSSIEVSTNVPVTSSSVSTASSSSRVDASIAQQLERTKAALEYSDNLGAAEKAGACEALEEARKSAETGDAGGLAEWLSKALELASNAAGAARAVLDLAPILIGMLPKS